MSTGWTLYIAILTIVNIVGCVWLLWWTAKRRPGEDLSKPTTGHVWDETLTEYNKPMPRWWLNLFYITIVFSLVYLVAYPGLGSFAGYKKWTSNNQHDADAQAIEAKLKPLFARFADQPLDQLMHDNEAVNLGRAVFANNCATCHGSDARGAKGFPNLTDSEWLWGGTPDAVQTTILNGRNGVMPALGDALGDQGVIETAVYVQSLSGAPVDRALADAGSKRFATLCVACHGVDGKGNQALGAPDLTNQSWTYGGSYEAIVETLRQGRNGVMPPHAPLIGKDRVRVAAAFVLAQHAKAQAQPAETAAH
jgi:cytochrome c oxidase cbb3-type subunit 3